MEEKKEFNATKYKNEYQKEHYKRRRILLKPEEDKKINEILGKKKKTLKVYLMEKVNEDLNK